MSRRSEHVKIMIHILLCKKKVNSILEEMSQQMDRKSIRRFSISNNLSIITSFQFLNSSLCALEKNVAKK